MSTLPTIHVENVSRSFRSVKKGEGLKGSLELLFKPTFQTVDAVKGMSFSIEEGSFVGLIGANGAGKTTLLKMLSGLIPPSVGEVRVLGERPFDRSLRFRHSISIVMGQKAQLWWDLPALDAFDLLRAIYEIPRADYRRRLDELTALLDVERLLHTQIRRLSLGERMKMELIGALLHWPKVVYLDEPTIGLDVVAAHKLREFLRVFNQKQRATIILTSHNMDDIERLCSRVMIMRSGEMIFDGKPQGLVRQGECTLRVRLKEDRAQLPEPLALSQIAGLSTPARVENEEDDPSLTTVFFQLKQEQIVQVLQAMMSKFAVIDMGIEEQSLESVIQRLFSERTGSPT